MPPCGTPDVSLICCDRQFPTFTFWLLFVRKELNQETDDSLSPYAFNFLHMSYLDKSSYHRLALLVPRKSPSIKL